MYRRLGRDICVVQAGVIARVIARLLPWFKKSHFFDIFRVKEMNYSKINRKPM